MTRRSYAEAIRLALAEEMRRDPTVFLMGEDIGPFGGVFGVTKGLVDEFGPERVRDTPISEQAIVGAALGAAVTGMRPVVELEYIDFALVAMDQIANMVSKASYVSAGQLRPSLVIRGPFGIGRSAAQHSHELAALFMQIPGLKVVAPATPSDARGLLKEAIRDDSPVVFLEHKYLYGLKDEVADDDVTVPFGLAEVRRDGTDITLVAVSRMVHTALAAAKELHETSGVSAEVVDLRTLVPMDVAAIRRSVLKTGRLIVVDEGHSVCGVGAEVLARVGEDPAMYQALRGVRRLSAMQAPIPFSPALEAPAFPSSNSIVAAAQELLA